MDESLLFLRGGAAKGDGVFKAAVVFGDVVCRQENGSSGYALDANGKVLWSFLWTDYNSAAESIQLDNSGRLYLSDVRVTAHNQARPGLVCLSE